MKGRRRAAQVVCLLALSSLLHMVFLHYLNRQASLRDEVTTKASASPVPIRIVLKPKTPNLAPQKPESAAAATPRRTLKTRVASAAGTAAPKAYPLRNRADFLPGAEYAFHPEAGGGEQNGLPSQEARTVSVEVAGKLDIPLFFRSKNKESHATAKLVSTKDGSWMFAYVDGHPVLRAVLFESLRDPINRRSVTDLLLYVGQGELLISLSQRSELSPDMVRRQREDVRLEGKKLVVTRWVFDGPGPEALERAEGTWMSMPLPDKEAKRAIMRDKVHLQRLEASPAYIGPIRNRRP